MPIHYPLDDPPRVVFEGHCSPEEADALIEWLRRTPDPAADLGRCGEVHTAVAQLLLAAHVRLLAPPPDAILAACLGSAVRTEPGIDAASLGGVESIRTGRNAGTRRRRKATHPASTPETKVVPS